MTTATKTKRKKVSIGSAASDEQARTPAPPFAALQRTSLQIYLVDLVRHPDNRHPTQAAIDAVAESMAREGQLEPILVRPRGGDGGSLMLKYEVISGETRWLAAAKLGWEFVIGDVVAMDNAAALRILAAANAARQDLDPIATAKLIKRLCEPVEAGGSGLTREAAARMFELKSSGAASNLVRLLELPEYWQERVAAGEVPQSYARELLRLLVLGPTSGAWEEILEAWSAYQADRTAYLGEAWRSREELRDEIDRLLELHSRPIEQDQSRSYHDETGSWRSFPMLFTLTPELERDLAIAEIEIDGQVRRRATNVLLYDLQQVPAIKKLLLRLKAGKTGGDEDLLQEESSPAKPLTPKQQAAADAARREEQTERLAKRIEAWRAAWLRELVAEKIVDERWSDLCVRLLVWQQDRIARIDFKSRESLHLPAQIEALYGRKILQAKGIGAVSSIIVQWLRLEARDGYEHPMPDDFVEDIVDVMKIDLDDQWLVMQSSGTRPERMQEFFELHSAEQLDALGAELGVGTSAATKKSAKVACLMGSPKTLKLPRSLKPLRKRGAR